MSIKLCSISRPNQIRSVLISPHDHKISTGKLAQITISNKFLYRDEIVIVRSVDSAENIFTVSSVIEINTRNFVATFFQPEEKIIKINGDYYHQNEIIKFKLVPNNQLVNCTIIAGGIKYT